MSCWRGILRQAKITCMVEESGKFTELDGCAVKALVQGITRTKWRKFCAFLKKSTGDANLQRRRQFCSGDADFATTTPTIAAVSRQPLMPPTAAAMITRPCTTNMPMTDAAMEPPTLAAIIPPIQLRRYPRRTSPSQKHRLPLQLR